MKKRSIYLWLSFLFLSLGLIARASEMDPADKTDKKYTGDAADIRTQVTALFQASRKVNGAEKNAARAALEGAMDWERISRECLGPTQWKKQPEKNRVEFEKLLHEVDGA